MIMIQVDDVFLFKRFQRARTNRNRMKYLSIEQSIYPLTRLGHRAQTQ